MRAAARPARPRSTGSHPNDYPLTRFLCFQGYKRNQLQASAGEDKREAVRRTTRCQFRVNRKRSVGKPAAPTASRLQLSFEIVMVGNFEEKSFAR